ncbi:uncharacterized protein LOC144405488 [Gasterosteus aculeatus]
MRKFISHVMGWETAVESNFVMEEVDCDNSEALAQAIDRLTERSDGYDIDVEFDIFDWETDSPEHSLERHCLTASEGETPLADFRRTPSLESHYSSASEGETPLADFRRRPSLQSHCSTEVLNPHMDPLGEFMTERVTTTTDPIQSEAACILEVQAENNTQNRWDEIGCRTVVEKLVSRVTGDSIAAHLHKATVYSLTQQVLEKLQYIDVAVEAQRHNIKRADMKAYKDLLKPIGCRNTQVSIQKLFMQLTDEQVCETLVKHMIKPKKPSAFERFLNATEKPFIACFRQTKDNDSSPEHSLESHDSTASKGETPLADFRRTPSLESHFSSASEGETPLADFRRTPSLQSHCLTAIEVLNPHMDPLGDFIAYTSALSSLLSNSELPVVTERVTTTTAPIQPEAACILEVQAENNTQNRWDEIGCRTVVEKLVSRVTGDSIAAHLHKATVYSLTQQVLEKLQYIDVAVEAQRHNIKRADMKAYKDLLKPIGCRNTQVSIQKLFMQLTDEQVCETLVKHMIKPKKPSAFERFLNATEKPFIACFRQTKDNDTDRSVRATPSPPRRP